jgi:hypothetical protein
MPIGFHKFTDFIHRKRSTIYGATWLREKFKPITQVMAWARHREKLYGHCGAGLLIDSRAARLLKRPRRHLLWRTER